ncbi:MAG TPA: FtsQ-type POTRA domain-containing protein [Solirubrobacteraceae bacterium]|jgi:cell division protein FtsQ|nr:FtsQ-type POTRA domain-containing protein [Solirubrobacteraceae bacterium]
MSPALARAPRAAVRAPAVALHVLPPRARLVIVGMTVVVAVLAGVYVFWLRDSSVVEVEHVHISGVSGANAAAIERRLAAAARDMTTLDVDADALRSAVAVYPSIRAVEADASFPHTLKIVVSERVPVGALTAGRRSVPVAADGTLLPGLRANTLAAVPVPALPSGPRLTNPAALRAVRVLAAAPPALRARVDELASGKGGLRATLRGGGTVVFGWTNLLAEKWMAAAVVLRDPTARGAKYLDVRIPRRPVAGGLPPQVDPNTGETIDPTTGQPVGSGDSTTDPLAAENANANGDANANDNGNGNANANGNDNGNATDPNASATTGSGADGTGDGTTAGTGATSGTDGPIAP